MYLNELKDFIKDDDIISFLTKNIYDELMPIMIKVGDLYKDWCGECMRCPENGAYVYNMMILRGGLVYPVIDEELFDFEQLMMCVEAAIK